MVERERVLHSQEQMPRVLETTLAKLGVDTSFDKHSLAQDNFTLGVKKVGEGTVFVGRLNHPFASMHFAQLLNNVSPFGDQNIGGIIADVELPIRARRDYANGKNTETSNFIRLHERHLNDPRVGPPYIRFEDDHVLPWLRALGFSNGWQVFERLQRIRFINSKEEVTSALSLEWQEILANIKERQNERRIFEIGNRAFRAPYQRRKFLGLSLEERVERIDSFLNKLDIQKKQKFAVALSLERRQILVDLGTHRIRSNTSNLYDRIGKGEVKFANNGRDVVISDKIETRVRDKIKTKVVITPTGYNSEGFSWKVIKYQFPEGYEKSSLYPTIVWKRDANGNRSFLTQQEAIPYVAELGLPEGERGDVKLGEIGVAYFSRDIIKNWPDRMTLKPLEGFKGREDDFEQPMRGAQMPAWVAIERHKAELLRSETSPLAIIEKNLALAA